MHVYEKAISDKINAAAGKDIYFHADEIMALSEDASSEIIGILLSYGCQGQNVLPIMISRECMQQFPVEWVSEKIRQKVSVSIDINDDWEYRRFLELCELISIDLLRWAISLNENSTDPYIAEAVDDFKEYLNSIN